MEHQTTKPRQIKKQLQINCTKKLPESIVKTSASTRKLK